VKYLVVTLTFCMVSLTAIGNILYSDDFCYALENVYGVFTWSLNGSSFIFSPCPDFSIRVENAQIGFSARLLKYSRFELTTRVSQEGLSFYIQDRKPFVAFNHFTMGFDLSRNKSIVFSSIIETYGILPDQFINLGVSLRMYENGERLLKLLAHVRVWQIGMVASMNYGGENSCGVSFYFSF